MQNENIVKLNIGAGQTYMPGFVNIDISSKADISIDLNNEKLPFNDSSVDLIVSYHTLEHIPNYLFILSECHRVLKNGGIFLIGLPYVTLTEYHLVNPYHLHNFNEYSFEFFDINKLKGSAAEENQVAFKKIFCRFHYIRIFNIIPPPIRSWCRHHLFNVVRKIDFGLVAIKNNSEVNSQHYDKNKYIKDLKMYLKSRIPYENKIEIKKILFRDKLKNLYSWWIGDDL